MMNGADSPPAGLSLTVDEIDRWKKRYAEIGREIEAKQAEREDIADRINAVRVLSPNLVGDFVAGEPKGAVRPVAAAMGAPSSAPTWPSAILDIVQKSGDGIEQKLILRQLRNGLLADRVRKNPNGFYNALGKLVDRGKLIKAKGFVFTPEQYRNRAQKDKAPSTEVAEASQVTEEAATSSNDDRSAQKGIFD